MHSLPPSLLCGPKVTLRSLPLVAMRTLIFLTLIGLCTAGIPDYMVKWVMNDVFLKNCWGEEVLKAYKQGVNEATDTCMLQEVDPSMLKLMEHATEVLRAPTCRV